MEVVEKSGAELRRHIEIPAGVTTMHVVASVPPVFSLTEVFQVKLSCGTTLDVVLQEDAVIHALYTDSSLYSVVGQEFCLLFDIMYAKTGTEALAEKQKMEGKQSLDVLALRSKIVDWCLTPVLQCDVALTEMERLYIGDKKHGPKKHYVPIYRDKVKSKIISLIAPKLWIEFRRHLLNFLIKYNF